MTSEMHSHSVHIDAPPERIFDYFNGVPVRGRYLEVEPPNRLVISWGHAGSARLPPGASTMEITLTATGHGTTVRLVHRDLPPSERAGHATGWAHFLRRLRAAAAGIDPGPDPWASG